MPVLSPDLLGGSSATTGPVPLGLTYTDPDGHVWWWSDITQPIIVTAVAGLGSPPIALAQTELPGGGALPQSYQADTKTVIVGLLLEHPVQDEFQALVDRLHRALWTVREGVPAPGTLTIYRPNGTERRISVLCTAGTDRADDTGDKSGLTWASYTLTFQALDPYWEDTSSLTFKFEVEETDAGVPAMPPVLLTGATVLGDTTVTNTGDVDAYPVCTITGPGQPLIENYRSRRSWGLNTALASGEVVTVDTRPTRQSAIDQSGTNRWGDLVKSSPRDLWPLLPGDNALHLVMTGSGTGSAIELSYTRRWLRA